MCLSALQSELLAVRGRLRTGAAPLTLHLTGELNWSSSAQWSIHPSEESKQKRGEGGRCRSSSAFLKLYIHRVSFKFARLDPLASLSGLLSNRFDQEGGVG